MLTKTGTRKETSSRGFAFVESVLVLMIGVLIAGTAYYIWHANQQATKDYEAAPTAVTSPLVAPKGYKTYYSSLGNFTMAYPSNWIFSDDRLPPTSPSPFIDQMRFETTAETTRVNNFIGNIDVYTSKLTPNQGGADTLLNYSDGTIVQRLPNGIEVWQTKESALNSSTGANSGACAELHIYTNGSFYVPLKDGKWITFDGSFCWGQGTKTTYTYEQQVSSPEFRQAISVLSSIKQRADSTPLQVTQPQ